jgi:aspartate kinase
VIVMKFGGTSVADAARMRAAAGIVRGRLDRGPVVVVSALAGVTDLLARAVACTQSGERDALEPILADLTRRHRWAVSGGIEDARRRHDVGLEVDALFEDLRQLLRSMRVLGEGTPRSSDALLAYGEILSSRIVAAAFADCGLRARLFDAREVMITDAEFGAAEPELDEVKARARRLLLPAVAEGEVPVLGGFFGATWDGRTTTLGRGGGDTSAAVLGAALSASEIEIWSDVDGVMTADPRRVPAARRCASVSFAEAAELAYYGAKVLHPASIAPAVRSGIPVRVLNALHPEGSGTLILGDVADDAPPLASVASRAGVTSVRVASRTLRVDPGFLPRVLAAVDDAQLVPDLVVASEVAVTLVLSARCAETGLSTRLSAFADIEINERRGIVCVVGHGLSGRGPTRGRVLQALAGLDPEMVALGASVTSLAALVPEHRLDACVRALHREFFELAAA